LFSQIQNASTLHSMRENYKMAVTVEKK